jgi:hypothetical protein
MFSLDKSALRTFCAALALAPVTAGADPEQKPTAPATPPVSAQDLPAPNSPQKNLRVPIYSKDGHRQMDLEIGVATKLKDGNLELGQLRFHTLKEDGKTADIDVQMTSAIFDKQSRPLSVQGATRVSGSGFELVGEKISFRMKDRILILEGATQRLQDRGPEAERGNEADAKPVESQKPLPPAPPKTRR